MLIPTANIIAIPSAYELSEPRSLPPTLTSRHTESAYAEQCIALTDITRSSNAPVSHGLNERGNAAEAN